MLTRIDKNRMSDLVSLRQQYASANKAGASTLPPSVQPTQPGFLTPQPSPRRGTGEARRLLTPNKRLRPQQADADAADDASSLDTEQRNHVAGEIQDAVQNSQTLRECIPQMMRDIQEVMRDMKELRLENQALTRTNLELLEELKAQRAANTALKQEMQQMRQGMQEMQQQMQALQQKHEQELMVVRDNQFQMLDQLRAAPRSKIEASFVLFPAFKPEPQQGGRPDKVYLQKLEQFSALEVKHIQTWLKLNNGDIKRVIPITLQHNASDASRTNHSNATGSCCRIEVHLRDAQVKYGILKSYKRGKLQELDCGPHKLKLHIRDNLLGSELKEKAYLQSTVMPILYDVPEVDRIPYGWRRSRITWWVPKPDGAAGEGAWALLSHLDVPPGSSRTEVEHAVKLATAKALAAASVASRSQENRDAPRGTGRGTRAAGASTPSAGAAAGTSRA
jgi:hypothetical protein